MLFDSSVSHSFIAASIVIELGLEVETLEEPLYMSSPLGIRARIGMICRGCELEISGILLSVDFRVMDISEFDVILRMDWLTAYRVVIDCERRRVTAYTQNITQITFQGDKHDVFPQTVYDFRWHEQLVGWLTSLTLEDEVGSDSDLPHVVCKYKDVFRTSYRDYIDECPLDSLWSRLCTQYTCDPLLLSTVWITVWNASHGHCS